MRFHYEINSTGKKTRSTLVKRIRQLAETDIESAIQIASWGKIPTRIEQQISVCHSWIKFIEQARNGEQTPFSWLAEKRQIPLSKEDHISITEKFTAMKLDQITKHFQNAIRAGDSAAIRVIADALDCVISVQNRIEPYRTSILVLKATQKKTDALLTIHEVAKQIKWPNRTKDGMTILRRFCKELNYPLARQRDK